MNVVIKLHVYCWKCGEALPIVTQFNVSGVEKIGVKECQVCAISRENKEKTNE